MFERGINMFRAIGVGVLFIWGSFAIGQSSPYPNYRIGPSDLLSIQVWGQEELNRTVTVRPDGVITYPLVGDLQVEGMTTLELRNYIADVLVEYINVRDSEITVAVDEVNSYMVSIVGEVGLPGRYSFQSQVTVLDVLAEAGGFSAFARKNSVVILRSENGEMKRIPFDYRSMTRRNRTPVPTYVYPGDIIMVP